MGAARPRPSGSDEHPSKRRKSMGSIGFQRPRELTWVSEFPASPGGAASLSRMVSNSSSMDDSSTSSTRSGSSSSSGIGSVSSDGPAVVSHSASFIDRSGLRRAVGDTLGRHTIGEHDQIGMAPHFAPNSSGKPRSRFGMDRRLPLPGTLVAATRSKSVGWEDQRGTVTMVIDERDALPEDTVRPGYSTQVMGLGSTGSRSLLHPATRSRSCDPGEAVVREPMATETGYEQSRSSLVHRDPSPSMIPHSRFVPTSSADYSGLQARIERLEHMHEHTMELIKVLYRSQRLDMPSGDM